MTGTIEPMTTTGLASLGWDPTWAAAFEDAGHVTAGHRPARVVAVHRETSIVRDADGDRTASVSGAFRFEALAASDFPTVGDWVAIDANGVIAAVLPRRTSFKRMAADASRLLSGLDDEQVMASNVDVALLVAGLDNDFNLRRIERYLAVAWSSEVAARRRPEQGGPGGRRGRPGRGGRGDRPGRRDHPGVGVDRSRAGRPARAPAAGHDRRHPRLVGRRQVDTRECPAGRGPPGDRGRPRIGLARPAHDDPSRTVRAARWRAPGRHAGDPCPGSPRRRGGPGGRLR